MNERERRIRSEDRTVLWMSKGRNQREAEAKRSGEKGEIFSGARG